MQFIAKMVYCAMAWRVEFLDAGVLAAFAAMPADIRASLARIVELIEGKTPHREIETALKRAKEVRDG